MIGEQPKTMKRHPAADNKSEPDGVICYFAKTMEPSSLFHPRVNNDLHAFAGHAGLHGLLCLREAMAEQTLPREGILVAQHHFHHGFVFIVRVIRHADNTQLARIEINGHGILSLLSPVLPVNRPYILYFITEFQHEVKKSQSYSFVTF